MPKNNTRQWVYVFFNLALILVFVLMIILKLNKQPIAQNKTHLLTIEQQQDIVYQIGIRGYKELIKDGCSNVIAEKIKTGKWSDYYCAEKYIVLDLK